MTTMNRLISGIFSLLLIALVIIAPIYLSDRIERIEIGGNDSLVSISDLTINYTTVINPYLELNDTTKIYQRQTYANGYSGWDMTSGSNIIHADFTSNIYGTVDLFQSDGNDYDLLYIYMEVDSEKMQQDNINTITLWGNWSKSWDPSRIWYRCIKSDYTMDHDYLMINNYGDPLVSGERTETIELSETVLNAMVSRKNTFLDPDGHEIIVIGIYFTHGSNNIAFFDFQIGPEYYEETVWNNQTTYTPYIQKITPFKIHKVAMGIGAVLIGVIGWIATPWGERFDHVLPINAHRPRRFGNKKRRG